jgi:tetratricopeptide (TPR) repeat protein
MKLTLLNFIVILFPVLLFAQSEAKTNNELLLEYYQNQKFGEATDYLIKNNPEPVTNIKTLAAIAYSSQMAGKLAMAETYYERIYTIDTTNTSVIFSLGNINIKRGNNSKAFEYYKKILAIDSNNFNVYKQLASISRNKGEFADQLSFLIKANKINPIEADVAYDLGSIYMGFDKYKLADSIINPALAVDTGNFILLEGKIQVDYHLERYKETISECNKLIDAGEQSTHIINYLGESYFKLKQYKDCINTFKNLEASNTASETSFYYMAMSFKALKDMKLAIAYLEKAIKAAMSGNVKSYYGEMADSFDQMKQPQKAITFYKKSLLYGELPLTYYEIANLYDIELHNKPLAISNFKKFIKTNPSDDKKAFVDYAKQRIKELSHH